MAVGSGDESRDVRGAVIETGHRWSNSQRELLGLVVVLDRSGLWALDGSPTCAHWVARALDIEVCTAREWIRVGAALERFGVMAGAFAAGRLSYSKVRMLSRVMTEGFETELCELAEEVPAGRLATAVAAWLGRREDPADTEARHQRARGLSWRVEPDGMVIGSFRLPPVAAGRLTTAVDAWVMQRDHHPARAESDHDASADAEPSPTARSWPSTAQQRADALVELVTGGKGSVRVETEVILHVRGDGCTLDNGLPIAGSIVERLVPTSFIRVLIHDAERRPINASGRQRHPTTRQKRVVRARDRACVDCGTTELLEDDHDPDYNVTHRTLIDELHTRCRDCHRARHRQRRS